MMWSKYANNCTTTTRRSSQKGFLYSQTRTKICKGKEWEVSRLNPSTSQWHKSCRAIHCCLQETTWSLVVKQKITYFRFVNKNNSKRPICIIWKKLILVVFPIFIGLTIECACFCFWHKRGINLLQNIQMFYFLSLFYAKHQTISNQQSTTSFF